MVIATEMISTPTLELAYLVAGPPGGRPVVLWHGFPDDATSYRRVLEGIAAAGYRGYAPYLRGVGPTTFRSDDTPRAGDFAALGQDAIDFLDGLDLNDAIVVGQDWGSPMAEIAAMMRPERVARLVKLNWYGIYTMAELAKAQSFNYGQLHALWYVWLLCTPMGELILKADRAGFARSLWDVWSPTWDAKQREQALAEVAGSFANPDFARVVLSAYRANIVDAERDPAHAALEERLKAPDAIACEAILLHGADDGVELTELPADATRKYFPRLVVSATLPGVGHFVQRERPDRVIAAIVEGR